MRKQITFFVLVGILIAVMIGVVVFYNSMSKGGGNLVAAESTLTQPEVTAENAQTDETSADNTDKAPDFTVTDEDGNNVKLSDFVGKPVVLNFWATWCGYCVQEMPDFNDAYAEYGENVQFMMLNATDGSRETVEKAKAFIEEKEFDFPVYFDTLDTNALYAFGVTSFPTTFFIDADGNVAAYGRGMLDRNTLLKGIGMIYDGNV